MYSVTLRREERQQASRGHLEGNVSIAPAQIISEAVGNQAKVMGHCSGPSTRPNRDPYMLQGYIMLPC